jgi:hypothetical protein
MLHLIAQVKKRCPKPFPKYCKKYPIFFAIPLVSNQLYFIVVKQHKVYKTAVLLETAVST